MRSHNKPITRFSKSLDVMFSNLSKTGRSRKQAVSMVVDATLVLFSLWAAYSLRHGIVFSDFQSKWHVFLLLPPATVLCFTALGIYRWVIRSSNSALVRQIVKGCILSSFMLILITYLVPPDRSNPRSLFIIFGMLLVLGTCGVRYLWSMLFNSGNKGEPIAIYGAGDAGQQLLRALSQGDEYRPVLFIDDSPSIIGTMVGGLPVIRGDSSTTAVHLMRSEVERVVLAMPSIKPADYQNKIDSISELGISIQTIPSYAELVAGSASLSEVRDVSIADILGRAEVPPDVTLLGQRITGKSVLVTGGGGSIGSELCRQIIKQKPLMLVVVDHSEENLYRITEELLAINAKDDVEPVKFLPKLCSVTDQTAIENAIVENKVNTIYHAAAYKHVPIIESYPEQGVRVNIFGTLTVLDAAITANVESFTLISTDKAVRPTNAMGASKRVAELVAQAKANLPNTKTTISMVRFGNVLGSSGSVVPKFMKQIDSDGPITITDPDMTRYFMTIPEAAQLVMQASGIANGGDVFVLDMGEPVRIEDLATTMVKMSGKRLKRDTGNDSDIEIEVLGLRPGEKKYEELFLSNDIEQTMVAKIFVANESFITWDKLTEELNELRIQSDKVRRVILKEHLLELAFYSELREHELKLFSTSARKNKNTKLAEAKKICS